MENKIIGWRLYTGSDEQIAEMDNADSFIIKANGVESHVMHNIDEKGLLVDCDEYLICNRHKYAKLIQRWSITGQPVWVRYMSHRFERDEHLGRIMIDYLKTDVTNRPDWNIPNAEYSFTEFEKSVDK